MAIGKRIKHYRSKAKWTLGDLSMASGVDVGTISALEQRDSKRSQFFPAIAGAFGLSVEQLAEEEKDHQIRVADLQALRGISDVFASEALLQGPGQVGGPVPTAKEEAVKPWPTQTTYDELTGAAIKIMQELNREQKFAMLAKMREFKQHLEPPRVGQALSVAG
jgi:transcriptional regulator with XRE-family HTH domain